MDNRQKRLIHIEGHIRSNFEPELIESLMMNIKREFNVSFCARLLASYALAKSMWAWFANHDLVSFRRWANTGGDLYWTSLLAKDETLLPYPMFLRTLLPVLSNNKVAVGRFVDFADNSIGHRTWRPKQDEFLLRQFIRAWNGDWAAIEDSCSTLAIDEYSSVNPLHIADFMFLNAIAVRDYVAMKYALKKMLEQRELRRHAKFESGYTKDLISTRAVIWCKLARMHNIEINLESDLIPLEWMPWDDGPYMPFEDLMSGG